MRNFLKKLKNRRKRKLRQLNLNDATWIRLGEIYSRILVSREVSLTNEEIIESAIKGLHKEVVIKGRLDL